MGPVILPIWGPIAIHSYGFFIAIGVWLFLTAIQKDARFSALHLGKEFNIIFLIGLLAALIGGRILHILLYCDSNSSWMEWFALWQPGYAVLGSIIGIVITVSLYLWLKKLPILPIFDLISTYAPLLQSVARVGCFFAGCCYGCPTTVPWAVQYRNVLSMAPLHLLMHPSQLYSAILLFGIFLIMYYYVRNNFYMPGQQMACYLGMAALERFIVDWWRGDRDIVVPYAWVSFSLHQIIAFILIIVAFLIFFTVQPPTKKTKYI
jgi:phosphatidylglycerol---prolipoprotein diacylglyceryl transferase